MREFFNKYSTMGREELIEECIRFEGEVRRLEQERRRLFWSLIIVVAVAIAALVASTVIHPTTSCPV